MLYGYGVLSQQQVLEKLKKAVSSTPLLGYYNLQKEVILQCDVSQSGLGGALLQNVNQLHMLQEHSLLLRHGTHK